jgi:hypothetical protein
MSTSVLTITLLCIDKLKDKHLNIFAIAVLVANIVGVVGLEITVKSNRSGKWLFKTYM